MIREGLRGGKKKKRERRRQYPEAGTEIWTWWSSTYMNETVKISEGDMQEVSYQSLSLISASLDCNLAAWSVISWKEKFLKNHPWSKWKEVGRPYHR